MRNIFDQKSELETAKRKLDKRLKNISIISESQNNNSFLNNNKPFINNNNNIIKQSQEFVANTKFLEEMSPPKNERNFLSFNPTGELDNARNRLAIQQKNLFEELEILKVLYH